MLGPSPLVTTHHRLHLSVPTPEAPQAEPPPRHPGRLRRADSRNQSSAVRIAIVVVLSRTVFINDSTYSDSAFQLHSSTTTLSRMKKKEDYHQPPTSIRRHTNTAHKSSINASPGSPPLLRSPLNNKCNSTFIQRRAAFALPRTPLPNAEEKLEQRLQRPPLRGNDIDDDDRSSQVLAASCRSEQSSYFELSAIYYRLCRNPFGFLRNKGNSSTS